MTTRILLVDDDQSQRKLSRAYLEADGFEVDVAACAKDALELARETRPDLIVSDVLMGDIDGFGFCRNLKADHELAGIPVMLVSSHYGGAANEHLAEQVGALTLVERTPTFERELAAVHRCLHARAAWITVPPSLTYEEHLRTNANQLSKLAEQERRSERRLRTLLDNANDAISVLTLDGVVLEANKRWGTLLGIDHTTMIGRHVRDFGSEGREDEVVEQYRRAVAQSSDRQIVALPHADGHTVYVEISTQVIELGDDRQVLAIGRDVTDKIEAQRAAEAAEIERRRLESTLAQAQKMEALGQLTGGIAHDFNNMLAVVLTYAHFLTDDEVDTEQRLEAANEIRAAAERGAALTRQLLAFSRRQMLEMQELEPPVVVANLVKMLGRLIGEDIQLEIKRAERVGCVRGDISQLEQVIMNLAVNARDAMPAGGRLVIDTHDVDVAPGGEVPAGEYVLLSVRDTGCGMTEDVKRRIFEPFFTTKERGKGTGLGLSTTFGIVAQFGGRMVVTSEVGRGTTMDIYLPRIPAPQKGGQPLERVTQLYGTETVLLVEDDRAVREALRRALVGYGYKVHVAAGAGDAIALARHNAADIDVIVSDVVMRDGNGPEVIAQLAKLSPRAKTLLISGYTEHAMIRDIVDRGPSYLQKPFSPETLVQKLRELLGVRP